MTTSSGVASLTAIFFLITFNCFQTMLEDKLKATDWEATNEAIEEQVARESYIQYFRDNERRLKAQGHPLASGSTSKFSSSSPRCSRRGSVSPKGCQSPKGSTSPKNTFSPLASPRTSYGTSSNVTNFNNTDIDNMPATYVPNDDDTLSKRNAYNSSRCIEQNDNLTTNQFKSDSYQQPGPSHLHSQQFGKNIYIYII